MAELAGAMKNVLLFVNLLTWALFGLTLVFVVWWQSYVLLACLVVQAICLWAQRKMMKQP